MKKNVIYISLTSFVILIVLIVFLELSITQINKWKKNNKKNEEIQEIIKETAIIQNDDKSEENEYKIDFDSLKKINSDVIGWLNVPGTNIDYSVVHTSDNSYYLTHNFNKQYNTSGWIFADESNKLDGTDKNIVIYGHNVRDNSMFGSLKNVVNKEWYDNQENYNIKLVTEKGEKIYKVFSVYQIEAEDYYIQTSFDSTEKFGEFIKTLQKRSVKDFDEHVDTDDKILTLSTCANNNRYRIVLHAKKIQ